MYAISNKLVKYYVIQLQRGWEEGAARIMEQTFCQHKLPSRRIWYDNNKAESQRVRLGLADKLLPGKLSATLAGVFQPKRLPPQKGCPRSWQFKMLITTWHSLSVKQLDCLTNTPRHHYESHYVAAQNPWASTGVDWATWAAWAAMG